MEDPALEQLTIGPRKNPSGAHCVSLTNASGPVPGRGPMVSDP